MAATKEPFLLVKSIGKQSAVLIAQTVFIFLVNTASAELIKF